MAVDSSILAAEASHYIGIGFVVLVLSIAACGPALMEDYMKEKHAVIEQARRHVAIEQALKAAVEEVKGEMRDSAETLFAPDTADPRLLLPFWDDDLTFPDEEIDEKPTTVQKSTESPSLTANDEVRYRNRITALQAQKDAMGEEILRLCAQVKTAELQMQVFKEETKNVYTGMKKETETLRAMIAGYRAGKPPAICCGGLEEKLMQGPPIAAETPVAFEQLAAKLEGFADKLPHGSLATNAANNVPHIAA